MSSDLLPESVNMFLDDFETGLCLPILVVMMLCTAQFVFNHVFGIGYTIYQNIRKPIAEGEAQEATDMMGKLKGQHVPCNRLLHMRAISFRTRPESFLSINRFKSYIL